MFILWMFLFVSCSTVSRNETLDPLLGIENISFENVDYGPTNKGKNNFIDKTDAYGLANVVADNFNVIDLNSDGHSDLVILENYLGFPSFYIYNSQKRKFEKASYNPLPNNVTASHLYFYDIDNDKILDVIVANLNRKSEHVEFPVRLFKGHKKNGRLYFRPSNIKIGNNDSYTSTISLLDFDLDGDLDLFLGNWFAIKKDKTYAQHDQLFENTNGTFINITDKLLEEANKSDSGIFTNARPTFASSLCDVDQNGYPDILTASTNNYSNKLWLNRYVPIKEVREFKDYGLISGYSSDTEGKHTLMGGGRTFTANCADYNNDGIMDIFLGELSHNYDSALVDKSSILTGTTLKFPPKFMRTEYFLDHDDIQWHQADRRAIWFDYDNDGLLDLLVDNSGYPPHSRLILFKQLSDHSFINLAKDEGIDIVNPQSSVIADFNQDGKIDILTSQTNMRQKDIKRRIYLFENQVQTIGKQSLRIYLRGEKSNRDAIGAMIILKINSGDEKIYRRQFVDYSQGGLAPQNEVGIHFALKEGESVDFIKVRWPYSNKQNPLRSKMEKVYKIKNSFKLNRKITLCENGKIYEGVRNCN